MRKIHMPKIEKGIPVLERTASNRTWRNLLEKMSIGDSFVVLREPERRSVIRSAHYAGMKVVTRKVNGEGWRIWKMNPALEKEIKGL